MSTPPPFGWIKGVVPFSWKASDGPMPVTWSAMNDDGTPSPFPYGPITVVQDGIGIIKQLYDSAKQPISGNQMGPFGPNGQITGYADMALPPGWPSGTGIAMQAYLTTPLPSGRQPQGTTNTVAWQTAAPPVGGLIWRVVTLGGEQVASGKGQQVQVTVDKAQALNFSVVQDGIRVFTGSSAKVKLIVDDE